MSTGPENIESRTLPESEALEQILVTVERLAMLHYHFAVTLVAELGEDRGRELVSRAIRDAMVARIRDRFQLPDHIQLATYLDVGFPAQTPLPPGRISVQEAVLARS